MKFQTHPDTKEITSNAPNQNATDNSRTMCSIGASLRNHVHSQREKY